MPEVQRYAKARKVGVMAMVERGGNVRAYVQPRDGALETVSRHVDQPRPSTPTIGPGTATCAALTQRT